MSHEPYRTSDTPFAAYLHYHKHVLVTLRDDPNDFRRKVYVFVEQDNTKELENEYYHGEGSVPAPQYYKSVRLMFAKLRELNNDKK